MKRVAPRAVLLLILCGSSAMLAGPPRLSSAELLAGVWGSEQRLGPLVRGELKVVARASQWHALIAGFDVPVERNLRDVRFVLPNGQGEFRGRLSADAKSIAGHWIQPASAIFSQRYATPVELSAAAGSTWAGEVHPLDERISFYVSVQRAPDGSSSAIIRNPEFGWFSRGVYRVELKGNALMLSSGQAQLTGTYDAGSDRLSLELLDAPSAPVVLSRRTAADAVGFYPRTPGPQPAQYVYRQPALENDGWTTAALEGVGIDAGLISTLVQSILAANPNDRHTVPVHSLLIARHGRLALEEYFYGFDRERTHDTRSAGKTIAPMLVGVARDHGARVQPGTPVYTLFPEYRPFANWDERKSKLTLEDLMTMTPGLSCDENDGSSPGREDQMQSQTTERDWYRYALNLPMARDPGGTTAIYCSASLNLVGGVAERASGIWNADLFEQYIARPLQFGTYHLNLMPTGDVYTGGGAYLAPRDELKLGQLYLAGGMWNGRRIISKEWVEQSTAYHATFIKPVIETDVNHQYGYGWHIHHFTVGGHVHRVYAAEGNGGQFVIVIPDRDMVVAINAGNYGNIDWYRWGLEVIPRYLIPAAR